MKISISTSSHFDQAMDKLRQESFPGSYPGSSADTFDSRSLYVSLTIDHCLAAYGRLTPGPNAVFETWTNGKAKIPVGPKVVDLGRCIVAPNYRGSQLIEILCIEAILIASEHKFDAVVGAVIPGRKLESRLIDIGFEKSGDTVTQNEPNRGSVIIQPLVIRISDETTQLLKKSRDEFYSLGAKLA